LTEYLTDGLSAVVGGCANLIARFPFVSFAATVVLCVGVGLFCGGGFTALQIVLWGIFDGLFHFHVPWYVLIIVSCMLSFMQQHNLLYTPS